MFQHPARLANVHLGAGAAGDSVDDTSSLLQRCLVLQPDQCLPQGTVWPETSANPEWGQDPPDCLRQVTDVGECHCGCGCVLLRWWRLQCRCPIFDNQSSGVTHCFGGPLQHAPSPCLCLGHLCRSFKPG